MINMKKAKEDGQRFVHRAKKSLGQNFLNSEHVGEQIIDCANLSGMDCVLEIGPGKGMLTEKLLKKAGKVIAVEKDDALIPFLQDKFGAEIASGKLTLVHDDILLCDLSSYNLKPNSFKLVANIPYYITGLLFRKFLEEGPQPSEMVVMVQKEVALRILARDKRESLLSVSVKVYGEPSIVTYVGAGNFTPKPNVDSAVLKISNISRDFFKDGSGALDEKYFFEFLKTGFAHKRKHLLGNLLATDIARGKLEEIFKKINISPTCRAENLTSQDWKRLAKELL